MAQYLNAELVNRKTGEVFALMSLSSRIRDMNYSDEFDKHYSLKLDGYRSAYDGDHYEGTITVANLRAAIAAKQDEIRKYEKKKASQESTLVSAKTELVYEHIRDWISTYEEIIDELNNDIESISKLLTMIEYECSWKDVVNPEEEVDQNTGNKTGRIVNGYPCPRNIAMEDVALNLWLNC